MELILGGAYQGKLTWAVQRYGLTPDDLCDLAECDPVPGKRCYFHLEAYTRRTAQPQLALFGDGIVISREIGSGVVPIDPQERLWRERHGTFLQKIAANSTRVTRIFCGLAEALK